MLSRLARELAAEIASHDWSDAPYRIDRAGHQRRHDSRRSETQLGDAEADFVRTNVMWVTAQVLRHADPNLDLYEYAAACAVPRSITHRSNGSRSGAVIYGLRWEDSQATVASPPGAPLWIVRMQCDVANLVVFKRLLEQAEGLDPSLPPTIESVGGATREVEIAIRGWEEAEAGMRAVQIVSAVSLSVADGTAAEHLSTKAAQRG